MTAKDADLLAEYARQNSQPAFAALVNRHVDLVYSAAFRQVRSHQLAEEVAQSVFADLARNSAQLKPNTVLSSWLYQVTRRTAIDVVRREARRRLREQIAVEMNAMNAIADDWKQIEPLLDDAMSALDEPDRTAVLLRYFENKSLRDVGEQLGISDDTAQKRVSRAVERLREFFSKRGVTVGASGLIVVICANAVQAAPAGLALTVSTTAVVIGAAIATTTTTTATTAIAMTTLQKTLVTITVAALAGAGAYETHQASQWREQVQSLRQQQAPLTEQVQQLQLDRANSEQQIAALRNDNERLNRNTGELLRLRSEVSRLQKDSTELSSRLAANSKPPGSLALRKIWSSPSQRRVWTLPGTNDVSSDDLSRTGELLIETLTGDEVSGAAFVSGQIAGLGGEAATTPVVHGSPAPGTLLIEWRGQWYPAEILESKDGKHLIRYTGYGSNWDEWVGTDRMAQYDGEEQTSQR